MKKEEIVIVGKKIVALRRMTKKEMNDEGWDHGRPAMILELEGGIRLYPSRDEEGNGPGALFGIDARGRFQLDENHIDPR